MTQASQPTDWVSIIAATGFSQISTSGKKVKTKDCQSRGRYPVIDQGQSDIAGYIDDAEKLISAASPLIVFGDHTRAVKWVDFSFVPGADGTKILQPEPYLRPRFAYYQLRSLQIPDKGYSRHFKFLKELGFVIPPLAEQKAIADKLDTLLAQVETTTARLERIPQILKRFRQSVLAAAVSGRLTEEWRTDSAYSDEGYPESWTFRHLSEVGKLARGKSTHRPRNDPRLFGEEYPFIQTGEVANATGEITTATRFYSEFGLQQSRLFPAGTLCITIAANIADTAILGIDACFPDSVVGFTPKDSDVLAYFAKYLIDVSKQDLESFAPATAQKNINLKVLNELRLPFPPLEEQIEIVRRVDQLFAHADRVQQQVQSALERVNNLTQSILAKAFRGELTEQWRKDNPELISGENSAAALLERIEAERAATAKPKRRTNKA